MQEFGSNSGKVEFFKPVYIDQLKVGGPVYLVSFFLQLAVCDLTPAYRRNKIAKNLDIE